MIEKIIAEILRAQRELADSTVRFCNEEKYPFNAGRWQGLEEALGIINSALNDLDEK